MKYIDIKVGMLVKSKDRPEISDKPGVVVGFIGDINLDCVVNIAVVDDAGQLHCCCADQLEPVHDECAACNYYHLEHDEIPCLYCRNNALPENPFYDKLPNLWEAVVNIEAEDAVQISKNDALLAADLILRYVDMISCMASACNTNTDTTDLQELARRIRNGVCK